MALKRYLWIAILALAATTVSAQNGGPSGRIQLSGVVGFGAPLPQAATPTFSPGSGTYSTPQSVTISASTGPVICYNTTGSPRTNGVSGCTIGTLYTGAVTVSASETLYAVSGGTGYSDSSVGSAAYVINYPQADAPTFSPSSGAVTNPTTVTASTATSACNSYLYLGTTNPPTVNTSTYSVTTAVTLYSYVHGCPGYTDSAVASASYTIEQVATPSFSPGGGTYSSTQTVTLSTTTPSAYIYYTTNDTTPTCSSTLYTGPITVSTSQVIEAIGCLTGYTNSAVASATYVISSGTVATPTFLPASGGTYNTGISSAVSTITSGASIFGTLDGSTSGSSSSVTLTGFTFPSLSCTATYSTTSTLFSALNSASAGNVICAAAGSYSISSTTGITSTGTSGNPIILYCPSRACIFKGTGSGPMVQVYNATTTVTYLRIIGFNFNGQNTASECFSSNGGAHIDLWWNAAYNCGGAGFYSNNSDYITYEHNMAFHNGYNTGDSSGLDFHDLGTLDSYTGFHNIAAYNVSMGNYDNGPHTDGNGIIVDGGGDGDTTAWPYTLLIGNIAAGNGGRGISFDNASNVWVVNNSTALDGLDQNQSTSNGEMALNGGTNINFVNNSFQSYNSHTPLECSGTLTSITFTSNIYYGGTNSGCGSSGLTLQNPNYLAPTAIASPAIVNGTSGQYANVLSPATGLLTNIWVSSVVTGTNPLSLVSGNLETDMANYTGEDFDGIARATTPAIGAYEYQTGTLLFNGQVPYLTQFTINAIGVKSGMTNSSQASASYTITIP